VSSTGGGALLGFGLCLLLVTMLGGMITSVLQAEVGSYESSIHEIYSVTHSEPYEIAMDALVTIGGYTDQIAEGLRWIRLSFLAEPIGQVSVAGSYMKRVRDSSEMGYRSLEVLESTIPQLLFFAFIGSIAMIAAGSVVIATRRHPKTQSLQT